MITVKFYPKVSGKTKKEFTFVMNIKKNISKL
jgi:hypothetical protein